MPTSYWTKKRIVITGGLGFLGSHLTRELEQRGANNIYIPNHSEMDLREKKVALKVTQNAQVVIHLAGNVGGIGYNQANPGTLFYDNIMMGINIIDACRQNLVGKLVSIGTICSYPKYTDIPFKEENLWNGYPEETNAPYGIAKKALITMSQAYQQQYALNVINLLPVNLYGPGDHFDSKSSHVIPALIKKFVDAKKNQVKEVIVWGTGKATREFFYVEDAAKAIAEATEKHNRSEPVNVGACMEISIKELAELIKEIVGFEGKIVWDTTKPDGQPRRMLDTTKAKDYFGFQASTDFKVGLKKTIDWYNHNYS